MPASIFFLPLLLLLFLVGPAALGSTGAVARADKRYSTDQHHIFSFKLIFSSLTAIFIFSCVEPSSMDSYIERTASRAYGWNIAIHPHKRYKYTPDTFYIFLFSRFPNCCSMLTEAVALGGIPFTPHFFFICARGGGVEFFRETNPKTKKWAFVKMYKKQVKLFFFFLIFHIFLLLFFIAILIDTEREREMYNFPTCQTSQKRLCDCRR